MESRPILYEDLEQIFSTFWELSSARPRDPMTGTIGYIPYGEISEYLNLHGIKDPLYREIFVKRIKYMDSILTQLVNEKAKKNVRHSNNT